METTLCDCEDGMCGGGGAGGGWFFGDDACSCAISFGMCVGVLYMVCIRQFFSHHCQKNGKMLKIKTTNMHNNGSGQARWPTPPLLSHRIPNVFQVFC
jgi:hypothetical protein